MLAAETRIRVKAPLPLPQKATRPSLTGDTKIRLSQIVKDKHSGDPVGTTRTWKDGKEHIKTEHGWVVNAHPGRNSNPMVKAEKQRVKAWATLYDEAKGMTPEQIFNKYPNNPKPIAMLSDDIVAHFPGVTNRSLYCGKAYFINHMVNHHAEVNPAAYEQIQDLINHAQKRFYDPNQNSLVLAIEPAPKLKELLVIKRDNENNRLILYKTRYDKKQNSYPGKFQQISPGQNNLGL